MKWLLLICLWLPLTVEAVENVAEAGLVRRISIFPFQAPTTLIEEAEDAWWKVRETLTSNRRFLVASRHFLNKNEVLQPRDELKPADVLVLARLLEAHALVTCYLTNERFHFAAYDGETGWPLWQQAVLFDQDIPLSRQIGDLAVRLTRAFIAAFPYQGFLIKNQKTGDLTVTQDGVHLAQVFVGVNHGIQAGQNAQVIRLARKGLGELFRSSGEFTIDAEGRVLSVLEDTVFVEVPKETNLREFQLVRFPEEAARLAAEVKVSKDPSELLLKQVKGKELKLQKKEKGGALITALSFIGNALLFIVLAF